MRPFIVTSLCTAALLIALAPTALAQTYQPSQPGYQAPNNYAYCQQAAQRASGYFGPAPREYRPRSGLEQAARQSAAVDGIAWLAGADKKKRKKLRQKAALDGLLKGAIRNGIQKDRERKARQRYEYELQLCMRSQP